MDVRQQQLRERIAAISLDVPGTQFLGLCTEHTPGSGPSIVCARTKPT